MVDTYPNMRESLWKGFRRRPQLGLSMWCTIFIFCTSLPCIFSKCQGMDLSVTLYPEGLIKLFYGKRLEILCTTDNGTSNNLEFITHGKHLNSEIVNSTTRRLLIENPEKQVSTYYCKNNVTGKHCSTRVLIDEQPASITDFSCMSKNLEVLDCTWTTTETFSKTNYSLSFIINDRLGPACIAASYGKTKFCSWSVTTHPRYKQMEDQYYFQLTSCNYFGCNQQNFTINHFAIVKPDPPESLRVLSVNPHSALLQWNIPNNIVDFLPCPVVHRIEYQIENIDTAPFHNVDVSILPPKNKTYNFLLSDLPYAQTQYEVRIYIKSAYDTEDKFWSDFSIVSFKTASDNPQKSPNTEVGSYYQVVNNEQRLIYVYWKQLEEYEEAGDNFTYKVVTQQGTKEPLTFFSKKNKSYVLLTDNTFEAIGVSIWSINDKGSSINSSHLYIPSKEDTEGLDVPSLTEVGYENGTHVLSWFGAQNVDNYTLFWCQHKTTQVCTDHMDFTVLDPQKKTHVIDLPQDKRYQFAVSVNKGHKSSAMIWLSCGITSKDTVLMYENSSVVDVCTTM